MSIDTTEAAAVPSTEIEQLREAYIETRRFTDRLVAPLSAEDCMVQSMDDVSPTRWHLAHTTWFFETFLLTDEPDYTPFNPQFNYLFNSYYNTIGKQFPRPRRGMISRPGLEEIKRYREAVDEEIATRLQSREFAERAARLIQIGIHHEQQHQELILTDIKHVLSCNPLWPKYTEASFDVTARSDDDWLTIDEGLYEIGHDGDGFAYDNESPRHRVFLQKCEIQNRLVTCGEYLEFVEAGGYQQPENWLSAGWITVNEAGWTAPLYWVKEGDQWMQFTLAGLVPIEKDWPVTHISLFEAEAFARWSGNRLPTEFEWEAAITCQDVDRSLENEPFVDYLLDRELALHPTRSPRGLQGATWQWTSSSYQGYPGYTAPQGAVGEYNGKFMCNQYVLRGGSVATHSTHIRPTYRNFFPADVRWQFTGIRLAKL